jgi:hypothetical protein
MICGAIIAAADGYHVRCTEAPDHDGECQPQPKKKFPATKPHFDPPRVTFVGNLHDLLQLVEP